MRIPLKDRLLMKLPQLPLCRGYWESTVDGESFDCEASNPPEDGCEDCLCNYHQTGGRIHPESGKTYPRWIARLTFGRPAQEGKDPCDTA